MTFLLVDAYINEPQSIIVSISMLLSMLFLQLFITDLICTFCIKVTMCLVALQNCFVLGFYVWLDII